MRRSCATRSNTSAMFQALGSLTAAAALMLPFVPLASCGDGPGKTHESDAMVKGSAPGSHDGGTAFDDAAADLQAAFSRRPDPTGPTPSTRTTDAPKTASRSKLEPLPKRPAPALEPEAKVYPAPEREPAALSATMPTSLDDIASRRDELVMATSRTIRAWADAGGDPTLAATQHAALAAFSGARTPPLPNGWLDSDQKKSADAIAGLMRDLAAQGSHGLDSATAGALLGQRASELGFTTVSTGSANAAVIQTGPTPTTSLLNVPTVALCRKVDSFGVYEPIASTTIQAGRQHTMIVYTEVEGFEQRASTVDDHPGFSSELAQTVMLYHDADGLLAWTRPEVTVRDTTRRQRRDYYLVQRLELPPTLTIGKYNLKIMVRDKLTGAEAETSVPINVVASTTGPGLR